MRGANVSIILRSLLVLEDRLLHYPSRAFSKKGANRIGLEQRKPFSRAATWKRRGFCLGFGPFNCNCDPVWRMSACRRSSFDLSDREEESVRLVVRPEVPARDDLSPGDLDTDVVSACQETLIMLSSRPILSSILHNVRFVALHACRQRDDVSGWHVGARSPLPHKLVQCFLWDAFGPLCRRIFALLHHTACNGRSGAPCRAIGIVVLLHSSRDQYSRDQSNKRVIGFFYGIVVEDPHLWHRPSASVATPLHVARHLSFHLLCG